MALTCPRCETEVPAEAFYCRYCNLPRPKRGFAEAAEPKSPETGSTQEQKPAVAFRKKQRVGDQTTQRQAKTQRRLRLPVVSAAALVAFLSLGVYFFVVPLVRSEVAEPKVVLSALERLRQMPSNEEGLTIDGWMTRELERSRRLGNLVSYQGWVVRPVKGTRTKVLLAFSYQEAGDVQRSADWLADLNNNTFTPHTDLAVVVSKQ